jgi:hypothetical protein
MLRHHRLVNAPMTVPALQRSGHLPPARAELTLCIRLGSHGFSRHLAGFSDLSRVPIVMLPQRRQLLIGGAFELVIEAMIAALGMVMLACWGLDDELDFTALAGSRVWSHGCAGVAHCVGVHQSAIADGDAF